MLMEEHSSELGTEAKALVHRIRERVSKMGDMINGLLQLAQLDRHELILEMTPLKSLVERVIADLESETTGRRIEWRIGNLPCAECDPRLMHQVFANLLSNAVKYTSRREVAAIEVSQIEENARTVIFVRDNGAGFDPKHASKLFGAFQRLHGDHEFEGVGVGLATVQRIIRRHGGEIWAKAEVQQGATFYFTLENL
jgi:light-regulated signal transduction histidine kinase (bacteriophytochrome)